MVYLILDMKPLSLILIVLTPIVIFLSVLQFVALNQSWYERQFVIHNTYEELGQTRVKQQTVNLFAFLKNTEPLTTSFYTERERVHLADVKKLYQLSLGVIALLFGVWVVCLALLIRNNREALASVLIRGGGAALLTYSIAGAIAYLAFDQIFLLFHQMIFSNDFWQLNPATEKLIVLFPPELFAVLLIRAALLSVGLALLLFMLAGLARYSHRITAFLVCIWHSNNHT